MNKSSISRYLPLLDTVKEHFQGIDLNDSLLICVQHLYSTTYAMFDTLFKLGLKPENLFVLGKCYSTDPCIYQRLQQDGAYVSQHSINFDSHNSYDADFEYAVIELLRSARLIKDLNKFKKIILLDDGGHLLEHAIRTMSNVNNIIGIEQTSSGFNKLISLNVHFPIINLARAKVKLDHETPIIINLVCRKLLEKLDSIQFNVQNVLILGYGVLGQYIHAALKDRFNVHVYDPLKRLVGSIDNLTESLNNYDLVVGCTGVTSLSVKQHHFCKSPIVFASVSSSDREFDAVHLRRQGVKTDNCHQDMTIGNITLLNGGFPVNFDRDHDLIDTNEFQLTRALIAASVCQAFLHKQGSVGFVELENRIQEKILESLKNF